ncbi:MAG: F0F1 ATP synthase subunit A [Planctomycetota bacterium]
MINSLLNNTANTLSAAGGEGGSEGSPFDQLFSHVVPQEAYLGMNMPTLFGLQVYDIQIFQVLSILVTLIAFAGVHKAIVTNSGGWMTRVFAGWVAWLRDEVVYPNLGKKDGQKLLPLFLSLFFFIAFMNLLGLVPGGLTATASVYVTAGLAVLTLLVMLVGGMIAQGPVKFWVSLIPGGVPGFLVPLIFPLEVAGLIIKPFALTMRLMANMTGGHLVILSFLGLMFFFGQSSAAVGWGVSPLVVGMSVFMMIIEGFVALLQAYVFTLLSVIFVGMCLHPDH